MKILFQAPFPNYPDGLLFDVRFYTKLHGKIASTLLQGGDEDSWIIFDEEDIV